MRRLFWLGLGVALGVLIFRRVSRTAQRFTPSGMAESLGGGLAELSEAVRQFATEVRQGMAEREAELREGAGLDSGQDPATAPGGGRHGLNPGAAGA